MNLLYPPDWIKSDGTLYKADATLPAGTYYAPVRLRGANAFGGTLIANAALIATATVDGNDLPMTEARFYAATGSVDGWIDLAAVTDVTMTSSAGAYGIGGTGSVCDLEQASARIKLVVATQGTCTFYPTIKDA
jgi:hypothetical protein